MIKTFRGKIASAGQHKISLMGGDSDKGYRIVKLELFPTSPGTGSNEEHTVKVYKTEQSVSDNTVNFDDDTLLAAGWLPFKTSNFDTDQGIAVFDHEVVNQDIYVTYTDNGGTGKGTEDINYYIELEMVKLDLNENTVATLKDIRNIEAQ